MPDGFEHLGPYNLVTFKSHQEALDSLALQELIGHGVNYRKQISPPKQELLPESDFRLYAVCVRRPRGLGRNGTLRRVRPGVYDAVWPGVRTIRVIVVHLLPLEERNAILHLFSAKSEPFLYAKDHYRPHSPEPSGLLRQLFLAYKEDPAMAVLIDDFLQEAFDELITQPPNKKRALQVMTPRGAVGGAASRKAFGGTISRGAAGGTVSRAAVGRAVSQGPIDRADARRDADRTRRHSAPAGGRHAVADVGLIVPTK